MSVKNILKRSLMLLCAVVLMMTSLSFTAASAEVYINVPLKITATDLTSPGTLREGDSFSLQGTVKCNYGVITKVTAKVTSRNGKTTYLSTAAYPNTQTVSLRSTVNQSLKFGKLDAGNYKLVVKATAKKGSKTTTSTIINKNFTVKAATASLYIDGAVYPSKVKEGNKAPLRGVINTTKGVITEVRAYIFDEDGTVMMKAIYHPNKKYFNLQYTLNDDFMFGILHRGEFRYKVSATAVYNGKSTSQVLINSWFTVY